MALTNNRGMTNENPESTQVVVSKTLYTRRADDKGWLNVMLKNGTVTALHENVKLVMLGEKKGRVYFLVSSDRPELIGQTVSLKKDNVKKYLCDIGPEQKKAILEVVYDGKPIVAHSSFKGNLLQQFAILTLKSESIRVTLNSLWPPNYNYSPIPAGVHNIMAPDCSHAAISTEGYVDSLPKGVITCNDVWFPIELSGSKGNSSRYIHLGNLSEGCITIYDLEKWNSIYTYLINHRTPGTRGEYIGEVVVKDKQ